MDAGGGDRRRVKQSGDPRPRFIGPIGYDRDGGRGHAVHQVGMHDDGTRRGPFEGRHIAAVIEKAHFRGARGLQRRHPGQHREPSGVRNPPPPVQRPPKSCEPLRAKNRTSPTGIAFPPPSGVPDWPGRLLRPEPPSAPDPLVRGAA